MTVTGVGLANALRPRALRVVYAVAWVVDTALRSGAMLLTTPLPFNYASGIGHTPACRDIDRRRARGWALVLATVEGSARRHSGQRKRRTSLHHRRATGRGHSDAL